MPTYVHLVRHAQGFHNLPDYKFDHINPYLTPYGEEQCAKLCQAFTFHDRVTHLVASPMRRTLQTCLLSFAPVVQAGKALPIIALAEIQEVSDLIHDKGVPVADVRAAFPDEKLVNLDRVPEDWFDKTSPDSPWAPEVHKLDARGRKARQILRDIGRKFEEENPDVDAHIVAVTHGGFLHFLTQEWGGIQPDGTCGWTNSEYRSYRFADPSGADPEASLKETDESWERRKGSLRGLTETEQMERRAIFENHVSTKGWDKEVKS